MAVLVGVLSCVLLLTVLWDAFETIILPRRVTRRFRLTRIFYHYTWLPWATLARRMRDSRFRETYLSFYGPLSLLVLFAVWGVGLILGFAMLHWACGSALRLPDGDSSRVTFLTDLYLSGTTFCTLGLGDVRPLTSVARALTVIEACTGFGFLAIVVGYLPVLYQAFSRRESNITLLDARAGSPPSAAELLRRHARALDDFTVFLRDWERWAADLMESHLSFPVLAYFRSQHDNQSWLAALTTVLDASALAITANDDALSRQAQLTFAMARHAVVDLSQIFNQAPRAPRQDRLSKSEHERLRRELAPVGVDLLDDPAADDQLERLRGMYDPYVAGLSEYLLMKLPHWDSPKAGHNWLTSRWGTGVSTTTGHCARETARDDHF
jgi:hypothetical protein